MLMVAKVGKYSVIELKMSRPKPTVILEHINNDNYKSDQVLEAEAIWAVFYQKKPFNLKA